MMWFSQSRYLMGFGAASPFRMDFPFRQPRISFGALNRTRSRARNLVPSSPYAILKTANRPKEQNSMNDPGYRHTTRAQTEEEWEAQELEEALADVLDEDGNIDIEKLNALSEIVSLDDLNPDADSEDERG
jgi:hypothetical protein